MVRPFRLKLIPNEPCRWRQVLLAGLVAMAPAQALVIRPGGSAEEDARRAEAAHQAGAKLAGVVGVATYERFSDQSKNIGTGVFLGFDEARTRGWVLTSAHQIRPDAEAVSTEAYPPRVYVHFGPDMNSLVRPAPLRVSGERVFLAPGFRRHLDTESKATTRIDGDLAIIEFDAAPVQAALAERTIEPVSLYERTDDRDGGWVRAGIAGFGDFGTCDDLLLRRLYRVHAGHTVVRHGTWEECTGFLHFSQIRPARTDLALGRGETVNTSRFLVAPGERTLFSIEGDRQVRVASHEDQAAFEGGDSGSPLFFDSGKGPQVAGIASGSAEIQLLDERKAGRETFRMYVWTPVADRLEWIRGVMNGTPGAGAEVIELNLLKFMAARTKHVAETEGRTSSRAQPERPAGDPVRAEDGHSLDRPPQRDGVR